MASWVLPAPSLIILGPMTNLSCRELTALSTKNQLHQRFRCSIYSYLFPSWLRSVWSETLSGIETSILKVWVIQSAMVQSVTGQGANTGKMKRPPVVILVIRGEPSLLPQDDIQKRCRSFRTNVETAGKSFFGRRFINKTILLCLKILVAKE